MLTITQIYVKDCPKGKDNCCNCPYYGAVVDGSLVCYIEEEESYDEE